MARLNRGKAHKLSIRLSSVAKQQVKKAAPNLGTSQAGIILFELSKLLKDLPSMADLQRMENDITLERQHFVMTINDELHEQIFSLTEDYGMKKNRLIGYIISDHFEKQAAIQEAKKN